MGAWEILNDWLAQLDINSVIMGLLVGLIVALISAMITAKVARRKGAEAEIQRLQPLNDELEAGLEARGMELAETRRALAVTETRLEEQQQHHQAEKASLEDAEKRLTESFERLAGKVFDQRSSQFTELSEKQLSGLLKPLTKDLETFRTTVDKNSREDIRQHAALQEKLKQMEGLNERLHKEAQNLTKALTSDVKAQGNWGEQQLERLMELAGLVKGEHYYTQYSTIGKNGERLQPDFVLKLPENRSIILDSKVSLTAWTRYQSEDDEARRDGLLWAASDGGLEAERGCRGFGGFGEGLAVAGHHRLVGGDEGFPAGELCVGGRLGRAVGATHHLDDNVEIRVLEADGRRFRRGDELRLEPSPLPVLAKVLGDVERLGSDGLIGLGHGVHPGELALQITLLILGQPLADLVEPMVDNGARDLLLNEPSLVEQRHDSTMVEKTSKPAVGKRKRTASKKR